MAVRQITPVPSNCFPQPPLDAIANNRFPDGTRYGEADAPWHPLVRPPNECRKERASDATTLLINSLELGSFSETSGLGEALRIGGFGIVRITRS